MKTRFLNEMASLLVVLLLFSCTGKFEEYNTDSTGFTDEQKTYDYNTFGVWLKVVQMGIYFNYDWGNGKNWHFQTMQNLNADMFSGYMHDFKPFNAGLGNTVYNLQDGWNGTMWDNTYGYIMTEIKQTEDHSRDKYPAFYAIAKILKVEVMHRISDYYGPIVYTKFGESDAGVMPDSQKDAYYAFFRDLGEAIHLLSEYDGEETFSRFDMIMPENYRTFGEWMRFANSLRLRLAVRIAMADPDKARDEAHKSLTHPAGLLEEAFLKKEQEDEYSLRLRKEFRYLQRKFEMTQVMDAGLWRFLRLRPENFPHIRLAQLAYLYQKVDKLFSQIMEAETLPEVRQLLSTHASAYWDHHYIFGRTSPQREKQMGEKSQNLIVINTVVPFLYTYGLHRSDDRMCDRAGRFLEELKAEDNHIIRSWRDAGLPVGSAADSQALIQLRKEYCDKRKCLYCRFGYEYLRKK